MESFSDKAITVFCGTAACVILFFAGTTARSCAENEFNGPCRSSVIKINRGSEGKMTCGNKSRMMKPIQVTLSKDGYKEDAVIVRCTCDDKPSVDTSASSAIPSASAN